jgi:hypothetical protein
LGPLLGAEEMHAEAWVVVGGMILAGVAGTMD